jgi:3-oxoacyl-[acyl-carrier protein] reductase
VADHYQRVREELGPVTVLVNNAGIMPQRSMEALSVEDWEATIRVNLSGAFFWCKQVVGDMKEARFGRIVNISSIAARGGGVVGPHYAASKAGLLGLTRYAARELAPYGITVNAIAPAFIEDAGIFSDWSDHKKAELRKKVVVPRLGTVQDVVRAFEYLLDSPFVTGVTLDLNGGAFMI